MAQTGREETNEVVENFKEAVNMSVSQLEKWLDTEESKSVGQKADGGGEVTGHHSGRRIMDILRKKHTDYTEDDIAQMRRIISYVQRHLAQRPSGDVTHTHWRYSLLNWGHEPGRDKNKNGK